MATLSTFRLCNVTPHRRRQVVSTHIPLARGQVTGSSPKVWTAVGAIDPGGGGALQNSAVQVTKSGQDYADGSWRMARAHFVAEIPAATTGWQNHPLWIEREIPITDTVGTLPTFALDPECEVDGLQFKLVTRGRPWESSMNPSARTVTFTALNDNSPDYHAPYTPETRARREAADTAEHSGAAILRAWEVCARVLPEAQGGDVTEPTFCVCLMYEVAADATGCGRFVRFWLEVRNSLITSDADPRDDTVVIYELLQDIDVEITNPGGRRIFVYVDATTPSIQKPPAQIADGWRINLYRQNQPEKPNRDDEKFPHLMGAHARGYIVFVDQMTTLERDTRDAISYQGGDQAFLTPVSTTWADTEAYGAFGVVHKPEDVFHTSLSNWRVQTARTHYGKLLEQRSERYGFQWSDYPRYTHRLATNSGGGSVAFCGAMHGEFAATGHPDLRAVFLSIKQDFQRPQGMRDWRGDVYDCSVLLPRLPGMTTKVDSRMWTYGCQPWFQDTPERGGKKTILEALRATAIKGPTSTSAYDLEHFESGSPIFYAFLTADRFTLDRWMPSLIEDLLSTRPTPAQWDSFDFGAGYQWNTSGAIGQGVPRSEGRPMKMKAHLVALTGRADLLDNLGIRVTRIDEWGRLGIPIEGGGGALFDPRISREVGCVFRDNRLFPTGYYKVGDSCGGGALAWSNPGDDGWNPFQQALMAEGLFAAHKVLEEDGSYATESGLARSVAARLGRSVLLYGYAVRGGNYGSIFGIDWLNDPANPGSPFDNAIYESPTTRYCNNGTDFLDDPYGPLNPAHGNVPFYRDNPSGSYRVSTLPGALLGAFLNPSDPDVQTAIAERLVTAKLWPDTGTISGNASEPGDRGYASNGNQIPQPFTRWTGGPGVIERSLDMDIRVEADLSPTVINVLTRALDMDVEVAQDFTTRSVVDPPITRSLDMTIELAADIDDPNVNAPLIRSLDMDIDADAAFGAFTLVEAIGEDGIPPIDVGGGGSGGPGVSSGSGGGPGLRPAQMLGKHGQRVQNVQILGRGSTAIRVPSPILWRGDPRPDRERHDRYRPR